MRRFWMLGLRGNMINLRRESESLWYDGDGTAVLDTIGCSAHVQFRHWVGRVIPWSSAEFRFDGVRLGGTPENVKIPTAENYHPSAFTSSQKAIQHRNAPLQTSSSLQGRESNTTTLNSTSPKSLNHGRDTIHVYSPARTSVGVWTEDHGPSPKRLVLSRRRVRVRRNE